MKRKASPKRETKAVAAKKVIKKGKKETKSKLPKTAKNEKVLSNPSSYSILTLSSRTSLERSKIVLTYMQSFLIAQLLTTWTGQTSICAQ